MSFFFAFVGGSIPVALKLQYDWPGGWDGMGLYHRVGGSSVE